MDPPAAYGLSGLLSSINWLKSSAQCAELNIRLGASAALYMCRQTRYNCALSTDSAPL